MSCCAHDAYDVQFDDQYAADELKRFRTKGPEDTARALVAELSALGVQGATLLDIGGGIGAIHHQLLDAGMSTAVHVDASRPYIAAARREAEARGHGDRVQFVHGDFVQVAGDVPPADVVTLDRVICCYGDMEALVAASAARARRLYAASFPRDRWYVHLLFAGWNLLKRVQRDSFRLYLYPVDAIDTAIRRQGFRPRKSVRTFVWHVALYEREPDTGAPTGA